MAHSHPTHTHTCMYSITYTGKSTCLNWIFWKSVPTEKLKYSFTYRKTKNKEKKHSQKKQEIEFLFKFQKIDVFWLVFFILLCLSIQIIYFSCYLYCCCCFRCWFALVPVAMDKRGQKPTNHLANRGEKTIYNQRNIMKILLKSSDEIFNEYAATHSLLALPQFF